MALGQPYWPQTEMTKLKGSSCRYPEKAVATEVVERYETY